ncbi:hypothetical protein J1614_012055 [Plenodomus biglobosus]|nr:hypothetical protein J1614_012055 [Plenodomus biglobosus]
MSDNNNDLGHTQDPFEVQDMQAPDPTSSLTFPPVTIPHPPPPPVGFYPAINPSGRPGPIMYSFVPVQNLSNDQVNRLTNHVGPIYMRDVNYFFHNAMQRGGQPEEAKDATPAGPEPPPHVANADSEDEVVEPEPEDSEIEHSEVEDNEAEDNEVEGKDNGKGKATEHEQDGNADQGASISDEIRQYLEARTILNLRAHLKHRGLKSSGSKAVLVDRLMEWYMDKHEPGQGGAAGEASTSNGACVGGNDVD